MYKINLFHILFKTRLALPMLIDHLKIHYLLNSTEAFQAKTIYGIVDALKRNMLQHSLPIAGLMMAITTSPNHGCI